MHPLPELLAPAGSFDAAMAAFAYGADAVYLGLSRFSARADAANFTLEELSRLVAFAHGQQRPRRVYVTLNTLIESHERADLLPSLGALEDIGVDAAIIQDLGLADLMRRHFPGIPRHASTQLACTSSAGARALAALGFERIVTARELSLEEAAAVGKAAGTEIEVFVHGALCYAVSGLCLYSSMTTGRSGNRGRCAYCCRQPFCGTDGQAHHPFSMRDLALLSEGDKIRSLPLASLKIEGRMKNPLYVAAVTDLYRKLLDGRLTPASQERLADDLRTIFSRPWTTLYADGPDAKPESAIDPLCVGHRGTPIGKVRGAVRDPRGTVWLSFRTDRALEKHDGLQIDPPGGGRPVGFPVDRLREARSRRQVLTVPAGATVEVALPPDAADIPVGATVYCSASQAVRRAYPYSKPRSTETRTLRPADLTLTLAPDRLTLSGCGVTAECPATLTPAEHPDRSEPAARRLLGRLGDDGFVLRRLTFRDPQSLFLPASLLNALRRDWAAKARETIERDTARRRAAVRILPERTGPLPESKPAVTLKVSVLQPPRIVRADPPDRLVVTLTSETTFAELRPWIEAFPRERLRFALPVALRDADLGTVAATVGGLADRGFCAFEAPDLTAWQLLMDLQPACGAYDITADWSWYAVNPEAVALQESLGIAGAVTGPEANLPNLLTLPAPFPREILVAQYPPLFISYTRPLTDEPYLTDRSGLILRTARLGRLWITFAERPWRITDRLDGLRRSGLNRLRVDISWCGDVLPDPVWRDLLRGTGSAFPDRFGTPRL